MLIRTAPGLRRVPGSPRLGMVDRGSGPRKQVNSVEVADNDPNKVMVRDTKERNRGTMGIQRDTWTIFVQHAKRT
ncbi:hypothetical protein GCM10010269_64690 [Streptomyces humidus]|uniref:DUF397 domain-containing protein n=2 Tax=Streptomyces humidus TaxID=52259 RepID=A0A918G4B1_9ACTN|nr:hypothetical protein GCM10010269_64690 [Streptomyces humidus]